MYDIFKMYDENSTNVKINFHKLIYKGKCS